MLSMSEQIAVCKNLIELCFSMYRFLPGKNQQNTALSLLIRNFFIHVEAPLDLYNVAVKLNTPVFKSNVRGTRKLWCACTLHMLNLKVQMCRLNFEQSDMGNRLEYHCTFSAVGGDLNECLIFHCRASFKFQTLAIGGDSESR